MTADPNVEPPSPLEKALVRTLLVCFSAFAIIIVAGAYEIIRIFIGLLDFFAHL